MQRRAHAEQGVANPPGQFASCAPAVFIDKDGTLVEDVPFNADPAKIRLTPGAAGALALLRRHGFRLFVISNQAGVARGLISEAQLHQAYAHMVRLLGDQDSVAPVLPLLDGFYYCPHSTEGRITALVRACYCRKPAPGLLLRAAREHRLSLARSWMIGDILDDIEAGHRAGCRAVLIDNGNETQWQRGAHRTPEGIVRNLQEAAERIIELSAHSPVAPTCA